ncbi:MAG: hypothetical protein JKY51_04465 [Opitutaceae bacterium]|nr:hypothetical protein [Opitutaceae bacterium]
MKYHNKDPEKLVSWLTAEGFPVPDNLPPKLLEQKSIGCRRLKWSEGQVAILCFNAETVYHLFIAQKAEFTDVDVSEAFEYKEMPKGWTMGKWEKDGYIFILTSKATVGDLSAMLANYTP